MTGDFVEFNSPKIKSLLKNYPNVFVTKIYLDNYIIGTPLEEWYFCSDWENGDYRVAHLSDALRLLTLYKYGGYYFDLDVIHLRPVWPRYRNFIVAENNTNVMHVDKGHEFIQKVLDEFVSTSYE